jgi:hypothetical protein
MPSTSIIDAADPALRIAQKRGFDVRVPVDRDH